MSPSSSLRDYRVKSQKSRHRRPSMGVLRYRFLIRPWTATTKGPTLSMHGINALYVSGPSRPTSPEPRET